MSTEIIILTIAIIVAMSAGFVLSFNFYRKRKDTEARYVF